VSFSWEENHRFTDSIRNGLKERAVLPAEGTCLTVNESLRWTNQQKRDWHRYETGQVVTFAPVSNRPASSTTVLRVANDKRLGLINGQVLTFPASRLMARFRLRRACMCPRSLCNGATGM
jgi:hypothetical protein